MQAGEPSGGKVVALSTRSQQRIVTQGMYAEVEDLLHHPTFLETRFQIHHNVRKSDHLLRSARYAWMIASVVQADRRTCARAGLLHDVHSRLGTWSTHGAIAASVADQMGESPDVCDAIVPHMYPMGPAPSTREGWVLAVADKVASVVDTLHFVVHLITGKSLQQRKLLRASDRFLRRGSVARLPRAA
jgi:glycyl-tRNA synthetase beta chain/uncharacterized protein